MKEEVIEAGIVPATATTTGDSVANPSYTAELDAPATGISVFLISTLVSIDSECYDTYHDGVYTSAVVLCRP